MKIYVRRALSLLLVAVLLCGCPALLTACHGSRQINSFEIPDTFDEGKTYEITFWAKNDTNKAQTAVYRKAIEDFQKLYPNITVNLLLYTDYNRTYNDVITNTATGTTPNAPITHPDHTPTHPPPPPRTSSSPIPATSQHIGRARMWWFRWIN